MIGYIKGEVAAIYEDRIVLECAGIGYNIYMPSTGLEFIDDIGSEVRIYTYLSVREDAMLLYGFLTKDDLDIFKLLITVNGIGPKGALAILSVMTADQLKFAIASGDSALISKAPGVGPKTAQRVILDLKDRIDTVDAFMNTTREGGKVSGALDDVRAEASLALVALGYSQADSNRAVRAVEDADDVETVLKQALINVSSF